MLINLVFLYYYSNQLYESYIKKCIGKPASNYAFWKEMNNCGIRYFGNVPSLEESRECNKGIGYDDTSCFKPTKQLSN